jgi:hypothetical protein
MTESDKMMKETELYQVEASSSFSKQKKYAQKCVRLIYTAFL